MRKLLPLIVIIPFLEIFVLLKLGQHFNFWPILLLIAGTGIIGWRLAYHEGLSVLFQLRETMSRGEAPGNHMVDGLLVFCGGVLLVLPGFLTDFAGFLALIPWTRKYIREWLKNKLYQMVQKGNIRIYHM